MYSDYQQPSTNKKKIIIVSVVMGLIILALIAVLINAIMRRNRLALGNKTESNSGLVLDRDGNLVEANSSTTTSTSGDASVSGTGTSGSVSDSQTNDNSQPSDNSLASNSATAGAANPVAGSATASQAPATSTSGDNLPTTGPAETFGLTLLLGAVAMYLVSRKINLRDAC